MSIFSKLFRSGDAARQDTRPTPRKISWESVAKDESLPEAFFRPMQIKDLRDNLDAIRQLNFPLWSSYVWFVLVKEGEGSVSVHFSIPDSNPGPRVGYVAARYLPYALAYVADGPVVGEGSVKVDKRGDIEIALGARSWKGF